MSICKIKSIALLISFFVLIGLSPRDALGQSNIRIDLSRETRKEVVIAINHFVAAESSSGPLIQSKDGRSILENDLILSGIFEMANENVYRHLEQAQSDHSKVDYRGWSRTGVQWLVQTQYVVDKAKKLVTYVFRLYDVVNEQFLIGKRYRGSSGSTRQIIHRFADEVVKRLTGKRGVASTKIVFLSRKNTGKELYTVDFDGFNVRELTNENTVLLSPVWSPDGRSIAYTSYARQNPDLVLFSIKDRKRKTLTRLPGLNAAPAWSPDGNKIAVVLSKDKNSEIYVLDRKGNLTRLTNHLNIDTSPTWSANGKKMAFTSDRSGTGSPQIYIMDSRKGDKSAVKRISFGSSYNDNPAWSPDGSRIAYTSLINGTFQIKIYNLDTKMTSVFTSGRVDKEEPSWSPDGRFIVFKMKRGRRSEIYVKRMGDNKTRQLTFLSTGGSSPSWSPNL